MNKPAIQQPLAERARDPQPPRIPRACGALKALLPNGVVVAELVGEGDPAQLLAGERQLLGRATPPRARELAAGRICARRAVAHFGLAETAIGARPDRRPRWPPSLTGSITHTRGFAAAAVAERRKFRAIGLDAERIGGVSTDMWQHLLLPVETERLRRMPLAQQSKLATLMFSAKEAFYKCQFEVTGQWLEFKDVAVEFEEGSLDRGAYSVRPVGHVAIFDQDHSPATGYYAVADGLVLTGMVAAAR